MSLRVPKNKINEKKYTSGGEYIIEKTNQSYKGYYYEFNNALYVGETFNVTSSKLIPIKKQNKLLKDPRTAKYGVLSGINLSQIAIMAIPFLGAIGMRFFAKKYNSDNIKEVNEDTYNQLKSDPLYVTQKVDFYYGMSDKELNEYNKKMPGLKLFLEDDLNLVSDSLEPSNNTSFTSSLLPTQLSTSSFTNNYQPPGGSVTDTPKPQDIIPVGPIYIIK